MAELYGKTPSELLGIDDEYTGYCLNEACMYIKAKLENDETPVFHKKYTSFADIYKNYGGDT